MAATEFAAGNALAQRLWAKKLWAETLQSTYFYNFLGKTADSLIHIKDEMSKAAGDRVTFGLRAQLSGEGISGDGTLEGNEEALTTYDDTLIIDQLRHAVRSKGKMSEQRVPFSVREENRAGLTDWWKDRLDTWFFNQIAGNTAQTDTRYTGLQAAIAPDSAHIYRPNSRATDQALTTGDEMSLTLIETMVARASAWGEDGSGNMPLRPISTKGGKFFVMFLHPYQVHQLRTNTNTAQWADLQKAHIQGGLTDIPLIKGGDFVGIHNGVVLHRAARIPNGVNGTTGAAVTAARRAVLCGAQAAVFGTGRDQDVSEERMSWVEETFDYGNQLGVSAGLIGGLKKTRFNSKDFGTFVCATYSPQP